MKHVRISLKQQIWILAFLACASIAALGVTLVTLPSIPHSFGARSDPACGSQLGLIGYSLSTERGYAGQEKPEFSTLPASHRQPVVDLTTTLFAQADAEAPDQAISHFRSLPHVLRADPIYALSSDATYLSCDYHLRDNQLDQRLANTAKAALVTDGAEASILNDDRTMEYVSIRQLGNKEVLQVAFVYLPVDGPHIAYVAFLDKGSYNVLWTAQANWYNS